MEARIERHQSYVSQVSLIAKELGYNLEFVNIENKPGKPDLILQNPKNGRRAYVEVEVTLKGPYKPL